MCRTIFVRHYFLLCPHTAAYTIMRQGHCKREFRFLLALNFGYNILPYITLQLPMILLFFVRLAEIFSMLSLPELNSNKQMFICNVVVYFTFSIADIIDLYNVRKFFSTVKIFNNVRRIFKLIR